MGPGGVKLPSGSLGLLGSVKTGDLIGEDVSLTVEGTTVKAAGTVKTVSKAWKEFDSKNNTGHFFPLLLPEKLRGKPVTLKGRKDGDRIVTVDDDLTLVVRLENLSGTALEIEAEGETVMTVDFTGVVPKGADAYDPEKTDFGGYGKMSDYVSDLTVTWDGVRGTAKGKLLSHGEVGTKKVAAGRHFPLSMSAWYDGVAKTVGAKSPKELKDKDIIISVGDTATPITAVYNGLTVLELDLSGMTTDD